MTESSQAPSIQRTREELAALPPESLDAITKEAMAATKNLKWIPNLGPQMEAYNSLADVLLFGGEPGGGKSQLILGLAFNCHERALIMRRQYTDLGGLTDEAIKINGGKEGYNGSPPPSIKNDKRSIEFGACAKIGDEQSWMGRARDLLGIDEATQLAEQQVRFLMGWVRSVNPKQRCRTVLATNPPLTTEGQWVIEMFAPWLDERYPNPAAPGELRWVLTDEHGEDRWVDGPGKYLVNFHEPRGPEMVEATSRTFIPSSLKDNPQLSADGKYQARLDALTEPYRTLLLGGFKAAFKDSIHQVIPTAWIREAQKRWHAQPLPTVGIPMCAIGVDCSGGGSDPLVLSPRYDGWFSPLIVVPGREVPKLASGSFIALTAIKHRRNKALIILDMGGGFGGGAYEMLKTNEIETRAYKGNEKSTRRTKDKQLSFFNVRSEAYWRFREALDPDQPGGSPIMLPDDPELVADLTAPTFEPDLKTIKIETKEDVRKRLGRSTNKGDAVVMAWYDGPKAITDLEAWERDMKQGRGRNQMPQVVMGRQAAGRGRPH